MRPRDTEKWAIEMARIVVNLESQIGMLIAVVEEVIDATDPSIHGHLKSGLPALRARQKELDPIMDSMIEILSEDN